MDCVTLAKTWRCSTCGWLNDCAGKKCASCDKRKPRAKKPKPPPTFRPWRCVILALDPAEITGWAVWSMGKIADHGEFKIYTDDGVTEVIRVVEIAKYYAAQLEVPWVAVCERPFGGFHGMGETSAVGYWKFAMRNAQLPLARIGHVYPSTWRARVLSKGMAGKPRDVVRAEELVRARSIAADVHGHDEAAAIMIGQWATQAGEVGELLPKNQRETV